jgi:hypothetical protein
MVIEIASIDINTYDLPWPSTPSLVDFKSQLEAKDVIIARL